MNFFLSRNMLAFKTHIDIEFVQTTVYIMTLETVKRFGMLIAPWYTLFLLLTYWVGTYYLFNWITDFHPGYLVDEVFHVELGLNYCQGIYRKWNKKVTTLPGLYWMSVPVLKLASFVLQTDTCTIFYLRMVNYIVGICILPLIGNVIKAIFAGQPLYDGQGKWTYLLHTINHALFPVSYFFTFFYYTEPMSVFSVFLMYYFCMRGYHKISAIAGIIAIMVRQTNVVWVGFIILLRFLSAVQYDAMKLKRYRKVINDGEPVPIIKILVRHTAHLFSTCDRILVKYLISSEYTYVCVLFISFVVANKGIVVGDKEAHSVVVHIPQLLYFSLFYLFFSPITVILSLPKFLRCIQSAKKETTLMVVFLAAIIYFNTLVHPYLLADNRHYAFYVWKRLYEGNVMFRYLLIPVYLLSWYSIMERLKVAKVPFMISYLISIVILLVPQKLFEFRYFILPFLFLSVNSPRRCVWGVFIESIYYILINAITFYLFATREIIWSNDQTVHRFLW